MTSFGTIVTLTVISGACILGALSSASAQTLRPTQAAAAPLTHSSQGFARCPRSVDQFVDTMKQLSNDVSRARALAEANPLLEADAAFYEAELAATRKCAPTVAVLTPSGR